MTATLLSTRLLDLRQNRWPGRPVLQARVAEAIGVSAPSVSSYEKGVATPSLSRLKDYAVFFASTRWLEADAPRRVDHAGLTETEREVYETLSAELAELRSKAEAPPAPATVTEPFWRFPDGAPIRIFCGRLVEDEDAGKYARPESHNFMALRRAADLDSLFELMVHVSRLNPDSDTDIVIGGDFKPKDLQSAHVVIVGNIAQMQGAGRLMPEKTLAVRQVEVEDLDGEVFEVDGDDGVVRYPPSLDADGRVTADVGLIARKTNPHNIDRTLTVCSGVFTHGVLGAVRCLTDADAHDANADFIQQHFENVKDFELLFNVRVTGTTFGNAVITTDLRDEDNRLFEIPSPPS